MVTRGANAKILNVSSKLHCVPPTHLVLYGSAAPPFRFLTLKPCYACWSMCRKVRIRQSSPHCHSHFLGGVSNGNFYSNSRFSSAVHLHAIFKTLPPRNQTLLTQLLSMMIICKTACRGHRSSHCCFVLRPYFSCWHSMAQGTESADQT